MPRALRAVILLCAMWLSLFVAFALWRFGSIAEPDQADFRSLLFAVGIGVLLQTGLCLLPDAMARGALSRSLVAVLMLPSAVGLAFASRDALAGVLRGRPLPLVTTSTYLVGLGTYLLGFGYLVAAKRPGRPSD